tara:strand:+ start:467 stop:1003 length:537 start_codon:yes stop_codon:yes gene_type:complete
MEIIYDRLHKSWWTGRPYKQENGKQGFYFYDRNKQLEVLFDAAYDDDLPKDPEQYWNIVSEVWQRTEFPYKNVEAWHTIFSNTPGINKHTQEWLKSPQMLYRGYDGNCKLDYDWSWTTDKDKAIWFANRFAKVSKTKPMIKQFDPNTDPYKVWCAFESKFEGEVLLWSPTAVESVNEF